MTRPHIRLAPLSRRHPVIAVLATHPLISTLEITRGRTVTSRQIDVVVVKYRLSKHIASHRIRGNGNLSVGDNRSRRIDLRSRRMEIGAKIRRLA